MIIPKIVAPDEGDALLTEHVAIASNFTQPEVIGVAAGDIVIITLLRPTGVGSKRVLRVLEDRPLVLTTEESIGDENEW